MHLKPGAYSRYMEAPSTTTTLNNSLLSVASTIVGELSLAFYWISYANKSLQ